MSWAAAIPSGDLFTTALTEAEMLVGLAMMPASPRRSALAEHIERIFTSDFVDRVLVFDRAAARALARMPLRRASNGSPLVDTDALLGAIARAHGAKVATRNVKDFQRLGVDVVNPWEVGVKS